MISARYVLHLLVGILVPLAILVDHIPLEPNPVNTAVNIPIFSGSGDFLAPLVPLSLIHEETGVTPVPDSAFAAIDALPITTLRPEMLAPPPVAAIVATDSANLRGGPGTSYDSLGALPSGTALMLLARTGDWFQARTTDGRIVWITAELLTVNPTAADLLPTAANIPPLPPPKIGLVAEENLNLRDGPGTNYIGMHQLDNGEQLDLLARYNEWFQVQTANGQVGWVLGQYLTIDMQIVERVERVNQVPDPNPALVGIVRESNINLRAGPGTAYQRIGGLRTDTEIQLLSNYGDWFEVRTSDGATGWVSSELVEVSSFIGRRIPKARTIPALPKENRVIVADQVPQAEQQLPAPIAAAGSVVEFAMQFVGYPYTWGGASPGGFDCSGFTQYVYKRFGLELPHSAAGQYSSRYGTIISNPADLRPGDIVFFANTYDQGISHVGIYIGNTNIVQAMSPKAGVGVASLNNDYWSQHYYSAIRPAL